MSEPGAADDGALEAALAELRAGRAELDAMARALDEARAELARAAQLATNGPGELTALREALATVVPELDRPAALVDGDLWIAACNESAAAAIGCPAEEAVGTPLARWPHALERSRLVRRALDAPPGPVRSELDDVAISLGLDDDELPRDRRVVLLLLAA